MISVIVWKEYREQRSIWLVFVILAAGLLVGLPIGFAANFDQGPESRETLALFGLILNWAYGMVCGGMMLAGECEGGTDSFLDTLPGGRRRLWVGKCIAGLIFVGSYSVFIGVLVATTTTIAGWQWVIGPVTLAAGGAIGFGWGIFASAYTRTVLGAIGLAIAGQLVFNQVISAIGFVLVSLSHLLFGPFLIGPGLVALSFLFALGVLLVPFALSARVYSRVDRRRASEVSAKPTFLGEFRRQARAILWLTARQMRGMTLWLLPISLALGFLVLIQPLAAWPLVTLVLGTACGVSCFFDEQAGPKRFLGDQRYPLGSIWGVKMSLQFIRLLFLLIVVLSPLLSRLFVDLGTKTYEWGRNEPVSSRLFSSYLVGYTIPVGVLLFTPALTGFVVGMLCGLVLRKAFIAVMAGLALALAVMGVWVPGLIVGGVPSWQVFLVPMILFFTARLLMRPWAAERLLTRRVVLALMGLVVGCASLLGLGQWYRVASIPDTPEPPKLASMIARLPSIEKNEAGQLIRSTLLTIDARNREWDHEKPTQPVRPNPDSPAPGTLGFRAQASNVSYQGWPNRPMQQIELAGWLDRIFADEVWKQLDRLPSLPVGVIDDPRRIDVTYNFAHLSPTLLAVDLLLARGLQMQHKSDPEVFVKHLEITLALARTLENASPQVSANFARSVEDSTITALDHWLVALSGRPDLLRRVGVALGRNRSALEGSDREHDFAEYLIALNSLDNPSPWLHSRLMGGDMPRNQLSEVPVVAAVWQLPWERERQERLLRRQFFSSTPLESPEAILLPSNFSTISKSDENLLHHRTTLEAARLRVALRHHQATTGKPATDLRQLVPASIDAIPLDPYDGKPFRYRLSSGEDGVEGLRERDSEGNPVERKRKIPAGQGILWSVGRDGLDGGGRVNDLEKGDRIFLVPLEMKKK